MPDKLTKRTKSVIPYACHNTQRNMSNGCHTLTTRLQYTVYTVLLIKSRTTGFWRGNGIGHGTRSRVFRLRIRQGFASGAGSPPAQRPGGSGHWFIPRGPAASPPRSLIFSGRTPAISPITFTSSASPGTTIFALSLRARSTVSSFLSS